jgi:predicted unusual protein kinase regulating ubiquinone biosynthesis (AarF/ABC1/UbiB family)
MAQIGDALQVAGSTATSTGEAVAIKVQRPGVAAALAMDMLLLRRFAGAVDAGAPAVLGAIAPTAVWRRWSMK